MHKNLLLLTDSYKVTHWKQYPPHTQHVYSFLESRGGAFPTTTFFGLQYLLKRYFEGLVIKRDHIEEARIIWGRHFGDDHFNLRGWRDLYHYHDGRLPIRIKAVPEGTTVPTGNVLLTIENTDTRFPWLTNWLETLLVQLWYPITVCTQSRAMRQILLAALESNGTPELVDFKLHDFGFRGSTSIESSAIGGLAHLVNFKGTDTASVFELANDYYRCSMPGYSIPAAEHSTITSWGREHEVDAYRNMLEKFPTGLVAVVSDSYDIFKACRELWGTQLHDEVLARDGVLVIRPDSGDPVDTLQIALYHLGLKFGTTTNQKGYRVLHPKIRLIQGDGIDLATMQNILNALASSGWSADNIAFGSGGGLLQKVNRDTCKFAMKCSSICIRGEWQDVMKDPITDPGKRSKRGRLALQNDMTTVRAELATSNQLRTVFEDGQMLVEESLEMIRERAAR